jgi:tetratricopeptide (TPR) repeat protein
MALQTSQDASIPHSAARRAKSPSRSVTPYAVAMAELGRPVRVFVSSASGALAPYRHAAVEVCHRLGLTPVHMEEFDPERPPPVEVCRREVESCEVVVLLLAHRYGARPPGEERSYTELEYEWALGRRGVSLLAFVVDPAFAWPPPDIDRGADAEALARFVARVQSSHVVKRFGELAAFREDLMLALKPHQSRSEGDMASSSDPRRLPSPPAFHAVPPYVGSAPFTGRLGDLATLDEWGRSVDPLMVVEAIGGTGKSALTWQWAQSRAPAVIDGLAGRLWWSFYEGSASITRFLRELLAYVTARPLDEVRRLDRTELAAQVFASLRSRPYLLVLDGFERLLAAYHRFDPSKLRDDEVEPAKRSLIEPYAEEVVRTLLTAGPSNVLISTRLMPEVLEGRFGQRIPGVRHLRLPGLTDPDTVTLLDRLGVRGDRLAIIGFFHRLGNHPLLVGIVAGLVRDYRPDPGGFDRWLTDPTAGGALAVPDLELTQRRAHILAAALAGLPPGHRRVLGWISVLAGSVDWDTLEAINPFQPEPPAPVQADLSQLGPEPNPLAYRPVSLVNADDQPASKDEALVDQAQWEALNAWRAEANRLHLEAEKSTERQVAEWRSSEPVARAKAQLDSALQDLEDRGLLWWDRSSNSYDLHPIVRAYVHDQLEDTDRVQANERVRDHFEALPPEDPNTAASVEDLRQTITIFRALVGAGQRGAASALWATRLGHALVVGLGAYATVVELLAPLAIHGAHHMRADLTIAYSYVHRLEEATEHETAILSNILQNQGAGEIAVSLSRLATCVAATGAEVGASRYLDLRGLVLAAVNIEADAGLCLHRGIRAAVRGQVAQALALLNEAESLGPPLSFPWFEGEIRLWRLRLALLADRSLTEDQLMAADTDLNLWKLRRDLARLRCDFFAKHGQFEQALAAAQEHERLGRNAGLETVSARTAFLLAKLGQHDDASAAVQESLAQLPRSHPAIRPHYFLAQALWELGRRAEAMDHAQLSYRQAWRDGPPYCHHWDLRDARELLDQLGVPPPDLPTLDPATVKVPLEDEVRAFIARQEAKQREDFG